MEETKHYKAIAFPPDMKVVGFSQIRWFRPSADGLGRVWSRRRFPSVGEIVLLLCALGSFSAACLARETPAVALEPETDAWWCQVGKTAADGNSAARFGSVTVEPEGWEPRGFRYRIVVSSITRGLVSSLRVTADAGGLRVIARDVDGVGNDLDLIVKSARTLAPVGIWLNDHRGGFIKADPGVYALSIWSEPPLVVSDNPSNILQAVVRTLYQFCLDPPARLCHFGDVVRERLVESADFAVPSRLESGARRTRGPPAFFHS